LRKSLVTRKCERDQGRKEKEVGKLGQKISRGGKARPSNASLVAQGPKKDAKGKN